MVQPPDARAGQRVSASFLNYCKDGVAAFSTGLKSVQEPNNHSIPLGDDQTTEFACRPANAIPAYSVFTVAEEDPSLFPANDPFLEALQISSADAIVYTNGGVPVRANEFFYPTVLNALELIQLQTYPSNPPAAGDKAGPVLNDWTVQKGGNTFLCVVAPNTDGVGWFLKLPTGSGVQQVGFPLTDIPSQEVGLVELYDKHDVPNGIQLAVYNPHDVTFYAENTTPGEEAPADRVILFNVEGWPEKLCFPFMLSECTEIDPTFEPEYA